MSRGIKKEEEDDDDHKDPSILLAKGFTNGILNKEYQRPLSRFFRFPHPTAYDIQLESAYFIYKAIETRKVAVLESPTGTGKTFSLICGAGTWLTMQKKKQELIHSEFNDDHNDKKSSKHERSTNSTPQEDSFNRVKPKIEPCYEDGLVQNDVSQDPSWSESYKVEMYAPSLPKVTQMKLSCSSCVPLQEDDEQTQNYIEPNYRLIYASRTHSQLDQFIAELKKTEYGEMLTLGSVALRTASFASRKQLCTNKKVQDIGYKKGIEAQNEECSKLKRNLIRNQKEKFEYELKKQKGQAVEEPIARVICPFMTCTEDGREKLNTFINAVHQQPLDIKDLEELGKKLGVCPYYGLREAAKQAQLITMTYNHLLNASTRKAIGVSLRDSVVIIDEAHNIIDTILQINSIVLTASQVDLALLLIDNYMGKVQGHQKLKYRNILRELEDILYRFKRFCAESVKQEVKPLTPIKFMQQSGGEIDRNFPIKLEEWLNDDEFDWQNSEGSESDNELVENDIAKGKGKQKEEDLQTYKKPVKFIIRSIHAFLLLVTDPDLEGRIHIPDPRPKMNTTKKWSLKYQLLDPAAIFQEIVDQAHCVILAGGTMKPLSDFTDQLFPKLEKDRFVHLECSHIVPKENIFGAKVSRSKKGNQLMYKYRQRAENDTLGELTEMLIEFSEIIPDGIVIFVPSYVYLGILREYWNKCPKDYNKLQKQKSIFFEPQDSSAEEVLGAYKEAIDQGNGAILFAVVNAKLSEGINFKDEMGRAVIVVGLPYANYEDPELLERQGFVNRLHERLHLEGKDIPLGYNAGRELYVNTCMKSVCQSIGRVIRHQDDYAAIILLDSRYEQENHNTRLPSWNRESIKSYSDFNALKAELQEFFKNRTHPLLT